MKKLCKALLVVALIVAISSLPAAQSFAATTVTENHIRGHIVDYRSNADSELTARVLAPGGEEFTIDWVLKVDPDITITYGGAEIDLADNEYVTFDGAEAEIYFRTHDNGIRTTVVTSITLIGDDLSSSPLRYYGESITADEPHYVFFDLQSERIGVQVTPGLFFKPLPADRDHYFPLLLRSGSEYFAFGAPSAQPYVSTQDIPKVIKDLGFKDIKAEGQQTDVFTGKQHQTYSTTFNAYPVKLRVEGSKVYIADSGYQIVKSAKTELPEHAKSAIFAFQGTTADDPTDPVEWNEWRRLSNLCAALLPFSPIDPSTGQPWEK